MQGALVAFGREPHSGWLPGGAIIPPPIPTRTAVLDLKILEESGGFIVVWKSRTTADWGDSWHLTLEDALAEVLRWFGIAPDDWTVVASPSH